MGAELKVLMSDLKPGFKFCSPGSGKKIYRVVSNPRAGFVCIQKLDSGRYVSTNVDRLLQILNDQPIEI